MESRQSKFSRTTDETEVTVRLDLDGTGAAKVRALRGVDARVCFSVGLNDSGHVEAPVSSCRVGCAGAARKFCFLLPVQPPIFRFGRRLKRPR